MKLSDTIQRRHSIMREIRALRKRHRRRKPLLNLLVKLTTLQLIQERRGYR